MITSSAKVVKDGKLFFVNDADTLGVWLVAVDGMDNLCGGRDKRVQLLPWMWSKTEAVNAVRRYKKYIGHLESYQIMTYEEANLFVKLYNIWKADCDFFGWEYDFITATTAQLFDDIMNASCEDWVLFDGGVTLADLEYYCFNIYTPINTENATYYSREELFENFRESWDYYNELHDKNI